MPKKKLEELDDQEDPNNDYEDVGNSLDLAEDCD